MNINALRKATALLCGVLLLAAGKASAQQSNSPAPLIQAPTDKMAWKITLVESLGAAAAPHDCNPERVASIAISKNGAVSKVIVTKTDGTSHQYWRSGNCTLYFIKERNKIFPVKDNGVAPAYPYASSGFYGIEHVSATAEQKPVVFEQTPCRYFRESSGDEAWFDAKSGLPKAFRSHGITFVYQFAPTAEELQLPPEYQAAAERYRANLVKSGLL